MQGNKSYRLIMRRGPQPNQVFELSKDITNLGRDITNDIVINDREVSRHHLRFMRGSDGFSIEDLGSTNGTFINGKRISGTASIKNGDMIGLGETVTLGYEMMRAGNDPFQQPSAPPVQAPPPVQAAPVQPEPAPYQAPPQPTPYQQPDPAPYQAPPQPTPYQQPDPAPYQPPASSYQPPLSQQPAAYAPTEPLPDYYPQQGSYAPPQAPAGYDYDPYAMREEGGSSKRWILIGCGGFALLCACSTTVALVAIDFTNSWCTLPGLSSVMSALGYCG